jgi:capsule polysaccharide export protein KpsE/RkpR
VRVREGSDLVLKSFEMTWAQPERRTKKERSKIHENRLFISSLIYLILIYFDVKFNEIFISNSPYFLMRCVMGDRSRNLLRYKSLGDDVKIKGPAL